MAAEDGYLDIGFTADADPDALKARAVERLGQNIPGYVSAPANPEVRILAETAEMAADREALAVDVGRSVLRAVANGLYRIKPIESTYADGTTTWVFADTLGHKILAGTHLSKDDQVFIVALETIVPPGENTATGVPITAAIPGAQGSGLTGTMKLEDAVPGNPTVTIEGTTRNGQDAEPQDTFENRAARRIRTWGRPVRPEDVENIALEITGVHRALAIDTYKPGPPYDADPAATDVERAVTVAVVDEAGQVVSSGAKTAVLARLQLEREANFLFWVIDPTYTTVKVEADITVRPGYDPQAVIDAAEAALAAFLSPATWGDPLQGEQPAWHDEPVVYRTDIAAVLKSVDGVRHVMPDTVLLNGADADVTLDGPAPLPLFDADTTISLA